MYESLEIIECRDPWDLLFRAGKHIQEQMSTLRALSSAWGLDPWGIMPAHTALFEAHHLIHECLDAINNEQFSQAVLPSAEPETDSQAVSEQQEVRHV